MSVRRRRSGLVVAWSRTLTVLSPWRRGKGDPVLDSEVVLTKVKALSRSQRNLLSPSAPPTAPPSDPSAFDLNPVAHSPRLDSELRGRTVDHLDSEDSGVDSPSSPLRSHTGPVHTGPVHSGPAHSGPVHSRGSSCDSGNPDQPETDVQETEKRPNACADLSETEEAGSTGEGAGLTDHSDKSRDWDEARIRRSDSSEEFAEDCCRLQTRSLSGLGYLEQVCRLVERISRLQDLVQHLQRELRTQRKDPELRTQSLDPELRTQSLDRHKLTFLMQVCTCGAADLLLSEVQTQNRTKSLSQTDQDRDLSPEVWTVPEVCPRVHSCRESAPCRRRRSRRSFTEDSHTWNNDGRLSREPSRRSSSSWGRVQDLLKTRTRAKSMKSSCPQLHRPDRVQARSSVILQDPSLDPSLDWPWLQ